MYYRDSAQDSFAIMCTVSKKKGNLTDCTNRSTPLISAMFSGALILYSFEDMPLPFTGHYRIKSFALYCPNKRTTMRRFRRKRGRPKSRGRNSKVSKQHEIECFCSVPSGLSL